MEVWKPITGYESYLVSNFGNVKNSKGKLLSLDKTKKGYLRVDLTSEGKKKHFKVHRLVAGAFIPNPNNLPQVNHKDTNKSNNHVDNLEWSNNQLNMAHAFVNNLSHNIRDKGGKFTKKSI